ncbi:hypothetical protein HDU92_008675, partial [Lobulomyces angularis]
MSCLCGEANWKREEIADHKFDYIDVDDFVSESFTRKFQYSWVFIRTIKSILVYMADIGILVIMITAFDQISLLLSNTNQKCNLSPTICGQSFDSLSNAGGAVSSLIPIPARL